MYLYEFNDDLGCNVRVESDKIPAQLPPNCYLSETLYQPDEIRATEIIGGVVQGMEEIPGPPEIYAHLTLSGGVMGQRDYMVQVGGTVSVGLLLSLEDDPAGVPVSGLSAQWPIVIREEATDKPLRKLMSVVDGAGITDWEPPENTNYVR